jgi:hypothetical protein
VGGHRKRIPIIRANRHAQQNIGGIWSVRSFLADPRNMRSHFQLDTFDSPESEVPALNSEC